MQSPQYLVLNFLDHPTFKLIRLLLLLCITVGDARSQTNNSAITLREDPQNPITADELAKAKLETSTPTFTYKDFYIGPQIGASILMDITGTLRVPGGSVDGDLEANTGVRLDIPMGYTLSDFFAFEFSPGVIYNTLSSASGAGTSIGVDGHVIQIPLLLNLIWSFNTDAIRFGKSKFRPYFGGGIGATFSLADISAQILSVNFSANSNTWSLGYQAIVGLDYDFDEFTAFGIRYQFTGTSNQNFSDTYGSVSTGGLLSQNISLRFIHRF